MVRLLVRVVGIGTETADMLVNEVLSRPMRDRRAVARYAGLTGAPDESGAKRREQGLAKAGNARVRRGMIPFAWRFLRFQKDSALARWYQAPHCRSPCRHTQNDDRRTRAQTAHRTLALCHHWREAGGRRLTSSGLKGVTGTSITTELYSALSLAFQRTAELTIRVVGSRDSNWL